VADLAKLTAERDALPGGNSDDDRVVVMTADEVREEFRAADRVGKRAMIKRALGRNRLFIDPAKPGRFDPDRVRLGPPPDHQTSGAWKRSAPDLVFQVTGPNA
jgi:hypothetical protein